MEGREGKKKLRKTKALPRAIRRVFWGKTQMGLGFGELVGLHDNPLPAWCPGVLHLSGRDPCHSAARAS